MFKNLGRSAPLITTVVPSSKVSRLTAGLNLKRWLIRLGGSLLLLLLLWRLHLNWQQVGQELVRANPWLFLVALALILPIMVLKAWRWRLILAKLELDLSFRQAIRLYGLGLSLGSITPGQAGDAIKAWYLQKRGYPLGQGLASVVLDRLFDVVVLGLLAVSGLVIMGLDFENQWSILICLVGLVGGSSLLLIFPALAVRLINLPLLFMLARKQRRLNPAFSTASSPKTYLVNPSNKLHPANLGLSLLITLGTAGLAMVRTGLLALAIGLSFSPTEVLVVSSLATVAALVPVTVSGIGARDLALVGVMGKLGQSSEGAVSLSVLLLLLNLLNLIIGYAVWVLYFPRGEPEAVAVEEHSQPANQI